MSVSVLTDSIKSWLFRASRNASVAKARICSALCSLDYSPIEETFSKLKAFLRRVGARTHEALQEAIGQALETVTAQDAHGWFNHCGYRPAQASEL
jgi:hypothetical protein